MTSSYYDSEKDNSFHNGDIGQSSPQPAIVVSVFPSGGTVGATAIGTSTATGGAYSSQSDSSTVGVNPIPDQPYSNMSQNNRFSYAGYDSSGIGQLSGVFGASSPALVNTNYASTPLTMGTISLAPPSSQPPTGSEPTMVGSSLVQIQENESFILGARSC
jgi:hypothetical protein